MYLVRGAVVSLGVFLLVYVGFSGIVACGWRALGRKNPLHSASALYGIRMLPLIGACGVVALFTVPSFLYLEPRFTDETIGAGAFAIAVTGAAVFVAGFVNGCRAWLKTSQFVTSCLEHSRLLGTYARIPAYEVLSADPALFVAGVWGPKLLVSSGAVELLDSSEIQAAIRHEVAHVHRGDNLKKLALRFCAFPFCAPLEHEWQKATEMAADDAAAHDEGAALDLASALVKMARATAQTSTPELGMNLIPESGAPASARVERLLSWKPSMQRQRWHLWWLVLVSAAAVLGLHFAWALAQMHEFTELLVR